MIFNASYLKMNLFALCLAGITMHNSYAQSIVSGDRYVALGSSYSAGPGVGTPDPQSGGCARSMNNYAQIFSQMRHLSLVDVSCSGATTDNILTKTQNGFAPQIDAVTSDTKLVTMTIGGNDVSYIGNLLGESCQDENPQATNCSIVSKAKVDSEFSTLSKKLLNVVSAIHQRAPNATIVFVDYLPVLPDSELCSAIPLSQNDYTAMRLTYERLTTTIMNVAKQSQSIMIYSARMGIGHDACSLAPYTNGYHPAISPGWTFAAAYHPNQSGMQMIADALNTTVPY